MPILIDNIPVPESIRCIADSKDRRLAWYFFIFFSRFEYALKRHPKYLKQGTVNAEPNWNLFASDRNKDFIPNSSAVLNEAVKYFLKEPPRKQIIENTFISWSEPQKYNGKEPLLIWLLRMIRYVRNNLFHGGKFPLINISDPSRNRELLFNSFVILQESLKLDKSIEEIFFEELD
jgi:hypothetical protein